MRFRNSTHLGQIGLKSSLHLSGKPPDKLAVLYTALSVRERLSECAGDTYDQYPDTVPDTEAIESTFVDFL